jgi:hypothetical protein
MDHLNNGIFSFVFFSSHAVILKSVETSYILHFQEIEACTKCQIGNSGIERGADSDES